MKKHTLMACMIFAFVGAQVQPGFAVSKETLQMMQQLDALQAALQNLQKTVDTQGAVLKTLVEQSNDNVNSIKAMVTEMRGSVQQSTATSGAKFDSMTTQMQALSESLDEAKARISKLSDQVTQMQNTLTTIPANPPATTPGSPTGGPTAPPVPTADSLYTQGTSYFTEGQYDLAMQAFQDYLKYYGDTDRASNAQYYIGECYYNQKDYKDAITAYDLCVEKYPAGNKANAAQLKKGFALLAMDERAAGVRELRSLVQRAPTAPEAELARQRLKKMGVATSAAATPRRRS